MTRFTITGTALERAIERRRTFHQYPEPSWCEFRTTSRLVDYVEEIGVDDLIVGREALQSEDRLGLPDDDKLAHWRSKAEAAGARADVLEATEGGNTGLIAVLEGGDGPVVGLRADIDALPFEEAADSEHTPAAEGFRSENDGVMHACGHDSHMSMGLGVLKALSSEDLPGTFKLFFQPAEENLGGGYPMTRTTHIDDVDRLFGVHVGLGHPTGTVVAGADKPLAIRQSTATFGGESAHAGFEPQNGRNTMQAMATAIQNLYGIARHSDDLTRVNVGRAEAGEASNIVADSATIELEVRAGSNDVLEHMTESADRTLRSAADMHECSLSTKTEGQAPSVDSNDSLRGVVEDAAQGVEDVETVRPSAEFGASEDVTYFMRQVAEDGGDATLVIVGTDHPSGHHTSRFDVDETSIGIGIDVLTRSVRAAMAEQGVEDTPE